MKRGVAWENSSRDRNNFRRERDPMHERDKKGENGEKVSWDREGNIARKMAGEREERERGEEEEGMG